MPLLFLTFLLVPLLEIYLLIEIGSLIGAVWTVTAVVGTAALGAALVRRQGLAALARFRSATQAGELPAVTIIEGLAPTEDRLTCLPLVSPLKCCTATNLITTPPNASRKFLNRPS